MHITHALSQLHPARWRLVAVTLVAACCVSLALAVGGAVPATASSVIQPNVSAMTAGAAATESLQATSIVSNRPAGWVGPIDSYYWESDCIAAGENGKINGVWRDYQCRNGSPWPWGHKYDLFVLP